jgi:beta-phosphoglucomutase
MIRLSNNIKAVIFDMDGVIVDSMPFHFLAWYEALRPYGIRVSCFDVYSKEGERWEKTLKDLLKRAGIKPTPGLLHEIFIKRHKIFKKYFKRFIFKDAYSLLTCLKRQSYSLGLVTGSPIEEVKRILSAMALAKFDAIVAGNQVKKGKPHPEPYLKAAKLLNLKPFQCVVIENAPFGIKSAKRAGMPCIALTTSLPKEYLAEADLVANNLAQISKLLSSACSLKR